MPCSSPIRIGSRTAVHTLILASAGGTDQRQRRATPEWSQGVNRSDQKKCCWVHPHSHCVAYIAATKHTASKAIMIGVLCCCLLVHRASWRRRKVTLAVWRRHRHLAATWRKLMVPWSFEDYRGWWSREWGLSNDRERDFYDVLLETLIYLAKQKNLY